MINAYWSTATVDGRATGPALTIPAETVGNLLASVAVSGGSVLADALGFTLTYFDGGTGNLHVVDFEAQGLHGYPEH